MLNERERWEEAHVCTHAQANTHTHTHGKDLGQSLVADLMSIDGKLEYVLSSVGLFLQALQRGSVFNFHVERFPVCLCVCVF